MSETLTAERSWTYERALAELEETNRPTEIWDGQLIMSPTPSFFHQVIVSHLEAALRRWVKRHHLDVVVTAPLDVVLEPDLVVQPDVMFISKSRTGIIRKHLHGAPDLAIEVVSPNRRQRDYKEKKDRYQSHGVREYWIADPVEKHIEVWWLNEEAHYELVGRFTLKQQAASRLLAGFKVRVSDIFADPFRS